MNFDNNKKNLFLNIMGAVQKQIDNAPKPAQEEIDVYNKRKKIVKDLKLERKDQDDIFVEYLKKIYDACAEEIVEYLTSHCDWIKIAMLYGNVADNIIDDSYWDYLCNNDKDDEAIELQTTIYEPLWKKIADYITHDGNSAFVAGKNDSFYLKSIDDIDFDDLCIERDYVQNNYDFDTIYNPIDDRIAELTLEKILRPCMDKVKKDMEFTHIEPYGFRFANKEYRYKYAMLLYYDGKLKDGADYNIDGLYMVMSDYEDEDAPMLIMSNDLGDIKKFCEHINNDSYFNDRTNWKYDQSDVFIVDQKGVEKILNEYQYDFHWIF